MRASFNPLIALLLLDITSSFGQQPPKIAVISICELSKDYGKYRDKLVAVRGVNYYGLRQQDCELKCANGPWPSFIDLEAAGDADKGVFHALAKVEERVELAAKKGKRLEIWVTAVGRLETMARVSPLGPCDKGSYYFGYGHLGVFPAQLQVKYFTDIEVKENPNSPYDYGNMYHGVL